MIKGMEHFASSNVASILSTVSEDHCLLITSREKSIGVEIASSSLQTARKLCKLRAVPTYDACSIDKSANIRREKVLTSFAMSCSNSGGRERRLADVVVIFV
jgi:UDP-N-acetylglucosamine transferase subunit ALG13